MRSQVEGELPGWLAEQDDAALARQVPTGTLLRARAYVLEDAVQQLTVTSSGDLVAAVRGSGTAVYRVLVRPRRGRSGWSGQCSCPVTFDCKHAVAAVLAARALVPVETVPAWRARLDELLDAGPGPEQDAPLALSLELVAPTPRPYPTSSDPRLLLRPLTKGRSGRWVKTGASWRDLDLGYGYTYGSVSLVRPQRLALRLLLLAWRASQPAWSQPYPAGDLDAAAAGPDVWRLLAAAREAGVELLPPREGQQVVLDAPARVVLDLARPAGGDAVLTPRLLLADGSRTAGQVLGLPGHGLVLDEPDRLLLAPLERPLDEPTRRLLTGGALAVPAADVPALLSSYYPALRSRLPVVSADASVALPEVRPPHLALEVTFAPGHLVTLRWAYGYPVGDEVVRVPLRGPGGRAPRDAAAEAALRAATDLDLTDRDLVGLDTARFAVDELPRLQARDDLRVTVRGQALAYAESTEPPTVQLGVQDTPSTDWFDLQVEVSVAGEAVPLGPLVAALTHGEAAVLLDSGTWFSLDRPELVALAELVVEARSLADRDGGLRLSRYHAGAWEQLVELGIVARQSERWERSVGALLALESLPQPDPPAGLQAQLRPYQREGYAWLSLLWDLRLGGVLADDMGLGKTLQTLAMAVRAREQGTLGGDAGPLLVVAPTSVLATWLHEAERFAPDLDVRLLGETQRRRGTLLADAVRGADVVVTSYAVLRLDADDFAAQGWCGVVLDEAQAVKNRQSKTYVAARRLDAPFTLVVTGTPLENSLMDLWSLLSLAAPGLFPSPQRFTDEWRRPVESGTDPERLAQLRRRIRPLVLRRTKTAVAPELPPKVEQVLEVPLQPAHRRVYDRQLQRERQRVLGLLDEPARNRIAILRSLTLMRQMSLAPVLVDDAHAAVPSSKLDALLELLVEVVAEGHRALVFSQFTGFLGLARERLRAAGLGARLPRRPHPRPAGADRAVHLGRGAGVPHQPQGRRHRPHPRRGRPRLPARPVVEPGDRGAGGRPRPPDRPGQDGLRAPPRRRRHRRGEGRRPAGPQARPVRPGRRRRRGARWRAERRRGARPVRLSRSAAAGSAGP